jgi:Uma2 family endonuclease
MPTIVHDRSLTEEILRERRALGNRTRDEVWEGVTHIMPEPDNEHQRIATFFGTVFSVLFGLDSANSIQGTANISDRIKGWKKNYRNPDMVYYSAGSRAVDHGKFWYGGPDFLLEIISPDDMSRDKLPFYASIGTKEVLILDRYPWQFELDQLTRGRLRLAGTARPGDRAGVSSGVVPLTFNLVRGRPRPRVRLTHGETGQVWTF